MKAAFFRAAYRTTFHNHGGGATSKNHRFLNRAETDSGKVLGGKKPQDSREYL
jgi:hypothetical protein